MTKEEAYNAMKQACANRMVNQPAVNAAAEDGEVLAQVGEVGQLAAAAVRYRS